MRMPRFISVVAVAAAWAATASAGQPLETETARLLSHGSFKIEAGFEHQTSDAGTETAVPLAFEYGVTDRVELLVEPVPLSAIRDKGAPRATGFGDLEWTLTTLLSPERARVPAVAFAAELKLPTAKNARIGSGKADASLYLIGSKRIGLWDTHANIGYTFIGRPASTDVHNVASFALAEELKASPRWDVVGEILGSTAALAETADGTTASNESVRTPEIGGEELVGTVGLRFHASHAWVYSLGVSLDNQGAVLVHPGFAVRW